MGYGGRKLPRTAQHLQLFQSLGTSLGEFAANHGVAAAATAFKQTKAKTAYWKKKVQKKIIKEQEERGGGGGEIGHCLLFFSVSKSYVTSRQTWWEVKIQIHP